MRSKKEHHGIAEGKIGSMKEHWERHYDNNPTKDTPKRTGSEFEPRKSCDRMTTHVKVNEWDQ